MKQLTAEQKAKRDERRSKFKALSEAINKREAHAKLIAYAPELLEALQQIVAKHYLRDGKHEDAQVHPDLIEQARQAINKATGKA